MLHMVSAEGLVDERSNRVLDEGVVGELSNQGIAHTSPFGRILIATFALDRHVIASLAAIAA